MFIKRIAAVLLTLAASVLVSQAQNAAQVLRPIGLSPGGSNLAPGQSQAGEDGGPQGQVPPGQGRRGGMRGGMPGMPPGGPNAAGNVASAPAPASQASTVATGYLLIKTLDTNHDGTIDAEEINNTPAALLTLDLNGDGKLSEDEYMAKGEPRPCFSPIYKILDLNENSVLDAKEIAGAAPALRVLDKNDGKLSASEYRPNAAAYAEHNAAVAAAAARASAPPPAPQP